MVIELQDQHSYEFACLDTAWTDCSDNDPTILHCRRLSNSFIPGDKDGPIADANII